MGWLEEEIQKILEELPPTQQKNFQKCVEDIINGNYRNLRGSEDALSVVIQVDRSCRDCRPLNNQLRNRIDYCLQLLIENS